MSSGFSFNVNVSGSGNNIAQGQTVTQMNHQSFGSPVEGAKAAGDMFRKMAEESEANGQPEDIADPDVKQEYQNSGRLLATAANIAEHDIGKEIEFEDPQAFNEEKQVWYARFKSLAPAVLKVALATGKGVLDAYVSKSPVIAGLRAAVDTIQSLE